MASDMPKMGPSLGEGVLLIFCIPALLIVPSFLVRTAWVLLVRDPEPTYSRRRVLTKIWLQVLALSLLPWCALGAYVVIDPFCPERGGYCDSCCRRPFNARP